MSEQISWLLSGGDGPLAGMRVLDLSQQLPGPYATALLAALGADVIKVEPPGGDAGRAFDPAMFTTVNRWKRGVRLDLKSDGDRAELLRLAVDAEVFVEGFRPGVVARLGCDYATVSAINPGIVYCSISGFGQSGPLASRPTHDISLQAMIGAIPDDVTIDRIGVPWVDLSTGSTAALLAVAAWHAGAGAHLDLAMLDAAASWARIKPEAVDHREPSYGTFSSRDGHRVVVALLEDPMWERLCAALGWDDWSGHPEYTRYSDRRTRSARIRERLAASLQAMTADEIAAIAANHDLPVEVIDPSDPEILAQLARRSAGNDACAGLPIPVDWLHPIDPGAEP
ncbi:CaiB/BaiF CoA transferase family protein [Compostimonas suwonensis]|uniref:Crotonobetainyl-CoA:carnitine CoA-transferase CaiB-like acyl-CoA transferase n=1 Tax=Compostimonas suwonensis TaxID=1048394 RepID=A0A2M9BU86_9MICO|nr:CoA transferase [Compostimonas suwonensis]PJJ61503.1 crotonobetainyl-CoA:carnitine CoA-transferase CaiB-like acyl-CoA transferase [Compostimonas suwonensis]